MPKILRINTKERTFRYEEPGKYAGLGGRNLTSRMVLDEVPADTHALSADNKIVAAIGLLSGTAAANSGRISLGAKSPLTGTIKESNSGGTFCQKLARLDILAMVLEDKPEADAADMVGKGTYESMDMIAGQYGKKASGMIIGPAGEACLTGASIQFSDPWGRTARAAGRGGLGAVMGSKKVKAVVLDDTGGERFTYADPEKFKAASKRWAEILRAHPVTGQGLPGFGTAILVNIIPPKTSAKAAVIMWQASAEKPSPSSFPSAAAKPRKAATPAALSSARRTTWMKRASILPPVLNTKPCGHSAVTHLSRTSTR
jgi:aldehyde:ferredoxin oxidoreductase